MYKYSKSKYSSRAPNHYGYYKKPLFKTGKFYAILAIIIVIAAFFYWSFKRADDAQIENMNKKFTDQDNLSSLSAKLDIIKGGVKIKTSSADWQTAVQGQEINASDAIQTEKDSRAIIELPDQSIIRLSNNTEVKINELSKTDIFIEQSKGIAYHRVNSQTTAIYRVKNGQTEMTALGTAFNTLASTNLTYLTVTESKVKVKIYDGNNIVNMRTVEEGSKATINNALAMDNMIKTENVNPSELLDKEWFNWNISKDKEKNCYLGMFEKLTKLEISEPSSSEMTTAEDKLKIKGETEKEAEIFIMGKEIENNNGSFETEIPLSPGENSVEITVKKGKNANKKIILVISTKSLAKITLTGSLTANTADLAWQAENVADFAEFKILEGAAENPSFPDSPFHTVNKNYLTDKWENLIAGKHFFRVCAFKKENNCAAYSNNLEINVNSVSGSSQKLSLTAKADNNNANLSWSIDSAQTTPEGFATIISDKKNPSYPGNSYHIVQSNQRNDAWKKLNQGKYYFRVCVLQNKQCSSYSDNAEVSISENIASGLQLFGSSANGKIKLSWINNNIAIDKGYKVIMDDKEGVAFPRKSHHLLLSKEATEDSWTNLEKNKTYYFRVCENTQNGCGVYSNEIAITNK